MITIQIFGEPIPGKRPRFSSRGSFVHTYDAQKQDKERIKWQIRSQYTEEPIRCPICIDVTFFMSIPKSTSGIRRKQMCAGLIHHDKKPDVDNLQKFVLDCMNKLVIEDDSQIAEIRAKKCYSMNPRTVIHVICLNLNQIRETPLPLYDENNLPVKKKNGKKVKNVQFT